jgi:hypothetical protein
MVVPLAAAVSTAVAVELELSVTVIDEPLTTASLIVATISIVSPTPLLPSAVVDVKLEIVGAAESA